MLILIGGASLVWGAVSLVNRVQQGGFSCLPSDFPKYPGATVTRDFTYVGTNVAPGDSRECQETLESNDNSTAVTDFYVSNLNSGDWNITANDRANGELKFRRASRPQTVGVVALLARGQHTVIEIKLDS